MIPGLREEFVDRFKRCGVRQSKVAVLSRGGAEFHFQSVKDDFPTRDIVAEGDPHPCLDLSAVSLSRRVPGQPKFALDQMKGPSVRGLSVELIQLTQKGCGRQQRSAA